METNRFIELAIAVSIAALVTVSIVVPVVAAEQGHTYANESVDEHHYKKIDVSSGTWEFTLDSDSLSVLLNGDVFYSPPASTALVRHVVFITDTGYFLAVNNIGGHLGELSINFCQNNKIVDGTYYAARNVTDGALQWTNYGSVSSIYLLDDSGEYVFSLTPYLADTAPCGIQWSSTFGDYLSVYGSASDPHYRIMQSNVYSWNLDVNSANIDDGVTQITSATITSTYSGTSTTSAVAFIVPESIHIDGSSVGPLLYAIPLVIIAGLVLAVAVTIRNREYD